MSASPDIASTLRTVSVQHLRRAPPIIGVDAYATSEDAGMELVSLAGQHRLLGALWDAVDSEKLHLTGRAAAELSFRHEAAMQWCLQIETRLLEVREWFAEIGGVRFLVLKGPAIAHLDELDPASRSFADLDLLVDADDIEAAVGLLTRRGSTRPWAERRPGYDRRFAKSVTLTSADGIEIDLHRTLTDGVHGIRVPLEELFASPEMFAIGGREVSALSLEHRVLHSMYHAVLGSSTPALHSLRDIAGYLTRVDVSPESIVALSRRWGGIEVVAEAVRQVEEQLGVDCARWQILLDDIELDPAELRKIDRQRVDGSSFGRSTLDQLREPGLAGRRLAFARAVMWPSATHLESRSSTSEGSTLRGRAVRLGSRWYRRTDR